MSIKYAVICFALNILKGSGQCDEAKNYVYFAILFGLVKRKLHIYWHELLWFVLTYYEL